MKILLADDHEMVLDSLPMLLATIEGVEVVGAVNNAAKVLTYLQNNPVDILISDMNMPTMNGIDLTLQVREQFPTVKILMLTVSENSETIREAFRAGVSGYIMKKAGKTELEKAIKTIANGEKYYSESVIFELIHPEHANLKGGLLEHSANLTDRELEIIKLISQEFSTAEIADKLFISPGTVETHRHNILRKLGVKNSIGVIKYALKHRLI